MNSTALFDKKVVIIGLDGIPFSLLNSYIEQGIMPNLKQMVTTGSLVAMNSTLPEVSSVAWTSFMTGKNPAEHGIFGFMEIDKNTYEYQFPNFLSIKVPTFWEELQVPTVAFNIPQTYPARATNGVLVSGFVALDLEKAVYPRRIYEYLQSNDYRLDVQSQLAAHDPEAFFKDLFDVFEKRVKAIKHLYENEKWQIFIATITETDRLHHFFFDSAQGGKYYDVFIKFYQELDDFLGQMFDKSQKAKGLFLTCSDHGFVTINSEVYVNEYLKDHGILKISGDEGLKGITSETRAFCLEPARVYVHLENKYFHGQVSVSDYERIREEIKALFESLTLNGQKVVRKVYFKEEIFYGRYIDEAPDLYVLGEPGFDMKAALKKGAIYGHSHFKGAHTYTDAHLFISDRKILDRIGDLSIQKIPAIINSYLGEYKG